MVLLESSGPAGFGAKMWSWRHFVYVYDFLEPKP